MLLFVIGTLTANLHFVNSLECADVNTRSKIIAVLEKLDKDLSESNPLTDTIDTLLDCNEMEKGILSFALAKTLVRANLYPKAVELLEDPEVLYQLDGEGLLLFMEALWKVKRYEDAVKGGYEITTMLHEDAMDEHIIMGACPFVYRAAWLRVSSGFETGKLDMMIARCRRSLEAVGRGEGGTKNAASWFELHMAEGLVYNDQKSFTEAMKESTSADLFGMGDLFNSVVAFTMPFSLDIIQGNKPVAIADYGDEVAVDNGGWDETPEVKRGRKCGVDRREELTQEQFLNEYVSKGKPVIFKGGMSEDWRTKFSKNNILKNHGETSITVFSSSEEVTEYHRNQHVNTGYDKEEEEGKTVKLGEWLSGENDGTYFFSKGSPLEEAEIEMPNVFQKGKWQSDEETRLLNAIWYIGGPETGVEPHYHSDVFNMLAYGVKKWQLWPPLMPTYEQASLGSLVCEQLGGETMYVPSFWNHNVTNLGVGVGVAVELGNPYIGDGKDINMEL